MTFGRWAFLAAILFGTLAVGMAVHLSVTSVRRQVVSLGSSDPVKRGQARMALLAKGTSASGALIVGLGHRDPNVRRRCCEVLGGIGDGKAIPALHDLLEDSDPRVREAAKKALVKLKDNSLIPRLSSDLTSDDYLVRSAAIRALQALGTVEAAEALVRAINSEPWPSDAKSYRLCMTQREIEDALAKLDAVAVEPLLQYHLSRGRGGPTSGRYLGILQRVGKEGTHKLLSLVEKGEPNLRLSAAQALYGKARDQGIRKALLRIAEDTNESEDLRGACLTSLSQSGDVEIEHKIVTFLKDKQNSVVLRAAAASALYGAQTKEARDILLVSCEDEQSEVRLAAIQRIDLRQNRQALTLVIKALGDSSGLVRRSAAYEIGRLGAESFPVFEEAVKSPNPLVREQVAASLPCDENPASDRLQCQLILDKDERVARAALNSCRLDRNPGADSALAKLAKNESATLELRLLAIQKLGSIGTEATRPVLISLSRNRHPSIASAALSALNGSPYTQVRRQ